MILSWFSGSSSRPPILLKYRSSKAFILVTVSTAIFTDIFLYAIVVPVLPFALTARSGVDPSAIQEWISIFLAVYGGALFVASPICGYLADWYSSRQVSMVLGLLALGGATAMFMVGNSIAVLAAGRVLQGISAAVVWVVGLALLVDTVGPEAVGQSMGYIGLSMSLSILIGPLLGGIVFAAAGYYAVFAMSFGLIALDIFLRLVMIERKVARKWLQSDQAANPTGTSTKAGEAAVEDVEKQAPSQAEISRPEIAHSPPAITEGNVQPIPPTPSPSERNQNKLVLRLPPVIYLLSSRRILVSLWACLIDASLMSAFDTILPLFVRDTFHWNSRGAGLIFLADIIPTFLGPVIGYLSDKHGPRYFATAGFVLACPCLILLRLVTEDSLGHKVLLCALLALIGLSLTLVLTPEMAEITYTVDAKTKRHPPGFFGANGAYAQAYSLFNMAWAGGTLVGPLLAGMLNQSVGWKITTLTLGAVSAVTAVPTFIWTGGSILKARRARRAESQVQHMEPAPEAEGNL